MNWTKILILTFLVYCCLCAAPDPDAQPETDYVVGAFLALLALFAGSCLAIAILIRGMFRGPAYGDLDARAFEYASSNREEP